MAILEILFFWVKLFYPKSEGLSIKYLLWMFFPQKVLRINGNVPWPVHFTSRVVHYKNITKGPRTAPGLSSGCYIQARNGIKFGSNVRIGANVGIISSNHSEEDYDKWDDSDPIEIGDNVWIGMNSVVLPGVKIGDNTIIGANSTVTKDIPSNSVAVGSPCKVIREKAKYEGRDYSNES